MLKGNGMVVVVEEGVRTRSPLFSYGGFQRVSDLKIAGNFCTGKKNVYTGLFGFKIALLTIR